MFTLLIIGLLVVSIAISKSEPKIAGVIDFAVALLLLFFRVIPGRADVFDWVFVIIFFLGGIALFFGRIWDTA